MKRFQVGFNTTSESETETDNNTNDGRVSSDDSTFGAKRQSLVVLQQLGLELGDFIIYDKAVATRTIFRSGDAEVKLTTNIHGLKTKVNLTVLFQHFLVVDLIRRTTDYSTLQNHQLQQKLLAAFMVKNPNVFGQDYDNFCIDFANTLYSLIELNNFDISMSFDAAETRAAIDLVYETTLIYGFGIVDFGGVKYLSAGAYKSVACVDCPKSKGAPDVITDSKKTSFYKSINPYEMLSSAINVTRNIIPTLDQCQHMSNYVKHLEVFHLHGNRQNDPIRLSGSSAGGADETLIEYDGMKTSIAEYFSQRYKIHLRYAHWPLAIGSKKINGNIQYFPVELLCVVGELFLYFFLSFRNALRLDCQHVSNNNIGPVDTAAIVKACAFAPSIKKAEVASCLGSFAFGINEFMNKAGMEVLEKPLEVKARVLKAPQVRYSNTSRHPEQNGKWRLLKQATFIKCASLKRWIAILLNVPQELMKLNEFKNFAEGFYNEYWNRGVEIAGPLHVYEVSCDVTNIEEVFDSARREQCEYILFDRDTKHHETIKGSEQKYKVITQCVKTTTIYKVLTTSPLSLENL
uniref:PAZ domain-containing protein n=1 Tax=Panagrolaimus davidi TaxID=227884 RepID=A0A914QQR0_9BILA